MTAILKNIYFDVLEDILDKYNNTVHKTIKMKPIKLRIIIMLNIMKIHQVKKILNLKLVTMFGSLNIKTFLQKDILQIGQKKILLLLKLKIQFLGLMLLVI